MADEPTVPAPEPEPPENPFAYRENRPPIPDAGKYQPPVLGGTNVKNIRTDDF